MGGLREVATGSEVDDDAFAAARDIGIAEFGLFFVICGFFCRLCLS
jgi:hypothetical protein